MNNVHPAFDQALASITRTLHADEPRYFSVTIQTPAGSRTINTRAISAGDAICNLLHRIPESGPVTITIGG